MDSQVAPVSRRWLAQLRLDLCFLQPIAKAMDFSPALRPSAPGLRHHGPGQPLDRIPVSPSPEYRYNLGIGL